MTKLGILGCGWLGFPLAKVLIKKDYDVKGTSTSIEKVKKLEILGVKSYHYLLENKKPSNTSFFKSIDTLIITIPFIKRGESLENLENSIKKLIEVIEHESIQNVIYLSSISVYDSQKGTIYESANCNPKSSSGINTLKIENLFNKGKFITTIIRLGGLIGENRHPIHSLSGKKFNKGDELINLIHQDDALGIILIVIENLNTKNIVYNAVTPFHPSKKEYYSKIAFTKNLLPPIFTNSLNEKKIINSDKIFEELNYVFKITDLYGS